jgi:hypothetical protein
MTPPGYPNFNSYMKNLRVLVIWTDREINPVWASLTTFLQVNANARYLTQIGQAEGDGSSGIDSEIGVER